MKIVHNKINRKISTQFEKRTTSTLDKYAIQQKHQNLWKT